MSVAVPRSRCRPGQAMKEDAMNTPTPSTVAHAGAAYGFYCTLAGLRCQAAGARVTDALADVRARLERVRAALTPR